MSKYPKISAAAERLAFQLVHEIDQEVKSLPDEGMPYKAQAVLEEVIELLKAAV